MTTLKELQQLAEAEFSVEDTRQDLNRVTEFFRTQPWHNDWIAAMERERRLSREVLESQKCFAVPEDFSVLDIPEELKAEALGIISKRHLTMSGRFVYPVQDVKGDVMGFCGWELGGKPKYLDSKNHGYKAKATTLFGMEQLPVYYRNREPLYITEGIVCCLYLRMRGLQSLAALGSYLTPYVVQILRRFPKLCVIPDNDIIGKNIETLEGEVSGEHFVNLAKLRLPQAVVVQSKVAKDVDDTRLADGGIHEATLLRDLKNIMMNPFVPLSVLQER